MKTKDIKPGVVYGYRQHKTASVQPVVFLATPGAEMYSFNRYGREDAPAFKHHPNETRPVRRSFDPDIGYPIAFPYAEGDIEGLTKITLDDFRTSVRSIDEGRGVRYDVLTVPSRVVGPYDEAVAEERRQREARQRQYEEEERRTDAARDRAHRCAASLAAHGIAATPTGWPPKELVIPLDDVEKLIGLLDGAS